MMKWHLSRDLNEVKKWALLSRKSIASRRNCKCKGPEVSTCLVFWRTVSRGGSVIPAMGVRKREKEDKVSTGKWRPHESLVDHAKDSIYLRWGSMGVGREGLERHWMILRTGMAWSDFFLEKICVFVFVHSSFTWIKFKDIFLEVVKQRINIFLFLNSLVALQGHLKS